MNKMIKRDQSLRACIIAILSMSAIQASADDWTQASGLLGAIGADPNEAKFMKDHNLKVGGWLNTSISANMHSNGDGFNGPITFNDRSGELQMNQLYLYLQKAINVNSDSFDIGGRVDFMYGTDAIFTQAYGTSSADGNRGSWDLHLSDHDSRFYGIALPQAYAEMNLPVGNGIDVKIGHFYTIIGYEVVTAPDNFFVTKPYTMQYGEPFTHTGVLASYAFNPNWSVSAGAVTGSNSGGWDGNWDRQLGNWSFLGGATWTSDDAGTSLALTSTAGETAEGNSSAWAMYSLVGKHNFTDKLHFIMQHDHGWADNALTDGQDAEWYGLNQYLIYDVTDKLSAGLRGEWFRDHNGFRVAGPGRCFAAATTEGDKYNGNYACNSTEYGAYTSDDQDLNSNYYAITAGLSYKPAKWLNLRPNLRYDITDGARAFDSGNSRSQFLVSADVVVTF